MARPTPIHRDPDIDGDDFGCIGSQASKGNRAVARLVGDTRAHIRAGDFFEGGDILSFVREGLEQIAERFNCSCCDTVVKENVFAALADAMESAEISDFDQMEIYGW